MESGRPKLARIDAAAAQDRGTARTRYVDTVTLKNLLYHAFRASELFAILRSIFAMTHGKQKGKKNQPIPP